MLNKYTQARISLGHAGTSIPLKSELAFKLAHAHARDAVHSEIDIETLTSTLQKFQLPVLTVSSAANSRQEYLQRPDLGRIPSENSSQQLAEFTAPNDISIVVADGLSATAINRNLIALLDELLPLLKHLRLSPITLVRQGRVAIADHVASILESKIALILIGERPGLTATDSIGAYLTFNPRPGLTDESRNCVSNIRPGGLSFSEAAAKIFYLISEANRLQLSGVMLKDNDNRSGDVISNVSDQP
ncbi:MAG: ethanolamine ammonia-lyase subunit EutC [Flavitalea sp.]